MKKLKPSILELMKQNREELLRDREKMEKIERRLEEKHASQK
ncbi:FbpB family small basic protein [Rossellomorea vietnamensis]|uniref:FbpB family small basic protein n=1 Tax=Rossellomorea vietnamensis TaxID=218284 RepID=A0A5D4KC86_9BACI|nr:FbpB family small basic protein [Rossellomorea vietnamensis]TYR74360.1 FbpB family small basic protein [Rossellomorea vietnamensis]